MLKERRTKHVEYRGVKLANLETGIKLPDGSLVVPVEIVGSEEQYGVPDAFSSDAPYVNLAKPLFSESDRFDTLVTGKTVVLEGAIEFETDMFIAADEAAMVPGASLTVKKDVDNVLKFGAAAGANVVVAHVVIGPADHADGHLVLSGLFK